MSSFIRFRRLLPLAALLLAGPASAQSPAYQGPLPVRNAENLNALVLQMEPEDARTLDAGRSRIGYHLDLANNLLDRSDDDGVYYVDHEVQRHVLSYRRGLPGGWDVGAGLAYTARNGGLLDSVISTWHKAFGMDGDFRESVPRRQSDFIVVQDGRTAIAQRSGSGALTSLTFQAKRPIRLSGAASEKLQLAGRAVVKIPLGGRSRFLDNGAVDVGLGVIGSGHPGGRFRLHGNLSVVRAGTTQVDTLRGGRRTLVQSLIAAEYVADGRTSFLVQTDDGPAPYRVGLDYPDRSRRMITAGVWRVVSPSSRAFVSFSENEFGIAASIAPDFTISTGVEGRW